MASTRDVMIFGHVGVASDNRSMDVLLTIGEFSKMTYLSVKALRHYHDVGLLAPVVIDGATGYRRYASSQVATAQAIRRFRELDMPLDDVREVLLASGETQRNQVIIRHLDRLQQQLERTQMSVASLQALLADGPPHPPGISYRWIPATSASVARQVVAFDECGLWLEQALLDLHAVIDASGLVVAGPDGALYPDEFFEAGEAEITAFVPVSGGGSAVAELPATTVAVLVHDGPFASLDQTYGTLGTAVAERGVGASGPIREHYLTPLSTEVCWPVTTGAHP